MDRRKFIKQASAVASLTVASGLVLPSFAKNKSTLLFYTQMTHIVM